MARTCLTKIDIVSVKKLRLLKNMNKEQFVCFLKIECYYSIHTYVALIMQDG